MISFLAIDTSSDACSVTIGLGRQRWSLTSEMPKGHAQQLLPFIHQLMQEHAVSVRQLNFIACCQGPGSFTGLRIGAGIAQGLAFGAGVPLVEVCSLAAMAKNAGKASADSKRILTFLDARMNEIYWALYDVDQETPEEVIAPTLSAITALPDQIREIIAANVGHPIVLAGNTRDLLALSEKELAQVVIQDHITPNSDAVADIAQHFWSQGIKVQPSQFELLYLRNSVSWSKRQRIRQ